MKMNEYVWTTVKGKEEYQREVRGKSETGRHLFGNSVADE